MIAGLCRSARDGFGHVAGDLPDALAREDPRVGPGLADGRRVVGPAGGDGGVAVLLEERAPWLPARGEHPQAVDEHNGGQAGGVGPADVARLAGAEAH